MQVMVDTGEQVDLIYRSRYIRNSHAYNVNMTTYSGSGPNDNMN